MGRTTKNLPSMDSMFSINSRIPKKQDQKLVIQKVRKGKLFFVSFCKFDDYAEVLSRAFEKLDNEKFETSIIDQYIAFKSTGNAYKIKTREKKIFKELLNEHLFT